MEKDSVTVDADKTYDFKYTITVPKDADPGTYTGAFLAMTSQPTSDPKLSQVGVGGRVVCLVSVTIQGNYTEAS